MPYIEKHYKVVFYEVETEEVGYVECHSLDEFARYLEERFYLGWGPIRITDIQRIFKTFDHTAERTQLDTTVDHLLN